MADAGVHCHCLLRTSTVLLFSRRDDEAKELLSDEKLPRDVQAGFRAGCNVGQLRWIALRDWSLCNR